MNILICDDQSKDAEKLHKMINEQIAQEGWEASITVLEKVDEMKKIKFDSYEIAFLDVDMGAYSGITLAKKLYEANPNTIIIFVTNYVEYAPAGYEVRAFRYMLKSDMEKAFPQIFKATMQEYNIRHQLISVTISTENVDVKVKNILYLESHQRLMEIHLINSERNSCQYYSSMAQATEKLEPMGFLRIQKSYLVNMEYISSMRYGKVRLTNGTELPVSEKNYGEIWKKYSLWRARNRWNIV